MSTFNDFNFQESYKKFAEMLVDKTLKKHGITLESTNISTKERQTILETVQQLQEQAQRFLDRVSGESTSSPTNTSVETIPSPSQISPVVTEEDKPAYSRFTSSNNTNLTKLFYKKRR